MKKGKQYSARRIKYYSILRSGFFYSLLAFGFTFIAAAASAALNFAELLSLYKEGTPESQTQSEKEGTPDIYQFSDLFFSVATAIITGYGAIRSGKNLFLAYFDRQLIHQNTWKDEIVQSVQKKHTRVFDQNGYEWRTYGNEIYLCSDEVDECLQKYADQLYLKVLPDKPRMNESQRQALYQIVSEKIAQGKNIFNSNLVRLRTDMLTEKQWKFTFGKIKKPKKTTKWKAPSKVKLKKNKTPKKTGKNVVWVQKTDYFSNITSNDLIYDQVFESDFAAVYDGKSMTVDQYGMLYNLTDSPAANIVGASTLAITLDGQLVVNIQNNCNDVNNNSCVPSGSGSADFEDLFARDRNANKKALQTACKRLREQKKKCDEKRKDALKAKEKSSEEKEKKEFLEKYDDYMQEEQKKSRFASNVRYLRSMQRYETSFGAFLSRAMERELMEESHLSQAQIRKTVVCGYIRLLNRGGKPDFFGFTFLNCDQKETEKMFKNERKAILRKELQTNREITDFNEVREQKFIPLSDVLSDVPLETLFKQHFGNKNVSVQLYYLFSLLRKNRALIECETKNAII